MIVIFKPLALPDEGNQPRPCNGMRRYRQIPWIAAVAVVLVFGASAASVVATATAAWA